MSACGQTLKVFSFGFIKLEEDERILFRKLVMFEKNDEHLTTILKYEVKIVYHPYGFFVGAGNIVYARI